MLHLLAEIDVPQVPAWVTAAGMLVSGVVGVLGKLAMDWRKASSGEKRDDYAALFDRQEKQLVECQKSIVSLLAEVGDLKEERAACHAKNDSLQREVDELRQENADLKKQLDQLRVEVRSKGNT